MQSVPVPSAVSLPLPSSGTPAKPPPPGSTIFGEALCDFKRGLSKKDLAQFQCVDFKDVEDPITNIQHDQKKKKKMQNIVQMMPFLNAMTQCQKVIGMYLTASHIIAYIWVSTHVLHCNYSDVYTLLTRKLRNTGSY